MASISFFNCPTFQHPHHTTTCSPPPEFLPFHDNYINHDQLSSFINNGVTNIPFQNPIKYPTLSSSSSSSSYNPLITQQYTPLPNLANGYYSYPSVPNVFDHDEFFLINPMEQMQPELPSFMDVYQVTESADFYPMEHVVVQPEPPSFPEIYYQEQQVQSETPQPFSEMYSMEQQLQPELPPLFPEIYQGNRGGNHVEERRISAQSMAARVRRRKISEKTSELGKLIPGGHKMTTAEMFQAAFNYIKFLQAQLGVLQLMPSSMGLGEELQDLITTPSVQEKLYKAGNCIVTQILAKTLVDDHQATKS